jgi:hypothetical protein
VTVWTADELRSGQLHWLLDFTWAGVTWRFAARQLEVTLGDDTYDYIGGLDWGGTLLDDVDPFTDAPEPRSATVNLWFPPGVDVPSLVEEGHDLGSASGVLRLWCSGTTRAMTMIDGVVREPSYATKSDPVVCTVEELPFADTALFPPALAVVDSTSWPTADEKAVGECYPWIIGYPPIDETTAGLFASPGLVVVTSGSPATVDQILIAGHACEATQVRIRNFADDSWEDFSVAHKADGRGRWIAYCDVSGASTLTISDTGDAYWVRLGPTYGGGLATVPGSTTMRGAGDVLIWMLRQSSIRWDRGRLAAVRDRLNAFKIDCAITAASDKRVKPWEWIADHLLPILPVSVRMGPAGIYLAWFGLDEVRTLGHLDADSGSVARRTDVSYSSLDGVASEFRLGYRLDAQRSKTTQTYILTGVDETLDADSTAVPHILCKRSKAAHGRRVKELSSDVVADAATAGKVCQWQASAFALQSRAIGVSGGVEWGYLEPGSPVSVSAADVGLSDAYAVVDSVPWRPGILDIGLRLLPGPARDSFKA